MNEPPTYRPAAFNTSETLYETSNKSQRNFTSHQELSEHSPANTKPTNENQYLSSSVTTSSISSQNIHNRNRQRERLQDPLKILSTIRNPSSRLNSLYDIQNSSAKGLVSSFKCVAGFNFNKSREIGLLNLWENKCEIGQSP